MMQTVLRTTLFCLIFTSFSWSQSLEDQIVMKVGDRPVTAGEFMRVYAKNLELVEDPEQRDIDNYLSLYTDYKLKVAEAYAQGLDTTLAHKAEYRKYKHQLATTYMSTDKVTDKLMKEAFSRMKEQVRARHIVIAARPDALPQDTLAAYNEIVKIREDVLSGKEAFDIAARKYSDDPSAASSAGELGWFSAFQMTYAFESMAYETPVGEFSPVFRSPFGFHFLEVQDRRALPNEVTAAHIMIIPKKDDPNFDAKARIDELYSSLQQGASFEDLARQYSADTNTAKNGGKLNRFGYGKLNAPNFEETTFSLENIGDYSEPFETDFGWHIVKLLERHDRPTYDDVKSNLRRQVSQAQRLAVIESVTTAELVDRYKVKEDPGVIQFFTEFLTDSIMKRKWVYKDSLNPKMKTRIFSLPNQEVTYDDFARFISTRQRKTKPYATRYGSAVAYYDEFKIETLRDYFKDNLDKEDPEFAKVVNEYKEGLLIFDLMDTNIWGIVKTDSIGLENFYNREIDKYQFKKRIVGVIAASPNKQIAKEVRNRLKTTTNMTALKEEFSKEGELKTIFTGGTFEIDARELPEGFSAKEGVSKVYNTNDQFTVIKVIEILAEAPKPLKEIRGKVMGDYQTYLESLMLEKLRDKYSVSVNKQVLQQIKNQLN